MCIRDRCGDDTSHWNELFEEQHYVVAENEEGVIVGFGSVNDDGYMHTEMMIAHHGIITGPFNAKNGHRPHSFRILGTKKPQS